jgi:cytochrome P450
LHGRVSKTHLIKKGSRVVIDTTACGLNPAVYADPTTFNPDRWAQQASQLDGQAEELKKGFMGFAAGERGCIGRRFAEVEMLSFLVRFLKRYRVLPIQREGEGREGMRKRYAQVNEAILLAPGKWDVELVRREKE